MGFKAKNLERRLILGYSDIYKADVKNMFPGHVTTLESYRLWLNPRHIVFIDQYTLEDLKHLIATAKKSKCESVILISRCGFIERDNNANIRLIQASKFIVEPNMSLRNTFNKIRDNLQKKLKKWDFVLFSIGLYIPTIYINIALISQYVCPPLLRLWVTLEWI